MSITVTPAHRSVGIEMPLSIVAAHIDELCHVNNVVILAWIQDVAIAHWQHLTTPERERIVLALRHD